MRFLSERIAPASDATSVRLAVCAVVVGVSVVAGDGVAVQAQTAEAPAPAIPGLVVTMPSGPRPMPPPPAPVPGLVVSPSGPPRPQAISTAPPKAPSAAAKPVVKAKPKPKPPRQADASPASRSAGTKIVALVNDEPITGFEVEQRARFMALSANLADKARANMQAYAQNPSTNERLKAILQETIKANPGKSREQIVAAFEERKKAFVVSLQRQAIESARSSVLPSLKKGALDELIDERLKLQEAKKHSVAVAADDVDKVFADMAKRNKMTSSEFADHVGRQGADASVIKSRLKASLAWRDVVRRRYGHHINVSPRDIEQLASKVGGEEALELRLQRITLATTGSLDQRSMATRLSEANALRGRFRDCSGLAALASGQANARHEDLGFRKPASLPEPTRSLVLAAKDGEMLPANLGASGVELYAVCGRRAQKIDEEKRQAAESQLQMKEFERLAQRYLYDLRKDALIEMR
ncbi:MAG: peptidylprolyl isomerase [Hyphomicrobiaceae bacterium]|nr:peptidylprolyl isomerase [Hyphomicrobiaceae bacterium]